VRRNVRRALRFLWITAGLSFTGYMFYGFQAGSEVNGALQSDVSVAVIPSEHGFEFRSLANPKSSRLIFLPGGMVEPEAYAPLLRSVASAGHTAHLIYLPVRCACTSSQRNQLFQKIEILMATEPQRPWILAGHSRGGMLATRFAHESGRTPAGLVLIGTTHPRDFSMADTSIPIIKIYGTRDGIASYSAMQQNRHLLPRNTTWIRIEGGNHVQFGYYRHQLGDEEATISRIEQQKQVEQALLGALSTRSHHR
jgi:pimeloyl-ACP methyl ester carboxylesterase